jgi:hypothetical protein
MANLLSIDYSLPGPPYGTKLLIQSKKAEGPFRDQLENHRSFTGDSGYTNFRSDHSQLEQLYKAKTFGQTRKCTNCHKREAASHSAEPLAS